MNPPAETVLICVDCGRRRRAGWMSGRKSDCEDERHTQTYEVTLDEAKELERLAKAYNAAKEPDTRAQAAREWEDAFARAGEGLEPLEPPVPIEMPTLFGGAA